MLITANECTHFYINPTEQVCGALHVSIPSHFISKKDTKNYPAIIRSSAGPVTERLPRSSPSVRNTFAMRKNLSN